MRVRDWEASIKLRYFIPDERTPIPNPSASCQGVHSTSLLYSIRQIEKATVPHKSIRVEDTFGHLLVEWVDLFPANT